MRPWWEHGVIYQIYPRSFQDGDADGIGDLAGVAHRLDYIAGLGVDAIWLSPIFPSPMADSGHDISDYQGIAPIFGDMAAFDGLVEAAHARGLKLVLDFVPSHSSDRHPWFLESRTSRDSPRRDWYVWRDAGRDGGPPDDQASAFGGSAWEWDAETSQYYRHGFLKEQPDLDWRNPEVRAAMTDVLRFWLDRGVDGFRIEIDQPEARTFSDNFHAITDGYKDRLIVGGTFLPHGQFRVHGPGSVRPIEDHWDVATLRAVIARHETAPAPLDWPNWMIGGHDAPRIAARVGEAQARVAAMLLLTLRGTPSLYQGDELGIGEVHIPADRIRDPLDLRWPGLGRDRSRTPMPWDGTPFAGFSMVEPWLPLNPDWRRRNVLAEEQDPRSMLALYKVLLALRRARAPLSAGQLILIDAEEEVLAYERRHWDDRLLVALNLGERTRAMPIPAGAVIGETLASTLPNAGRAAALAPNEGRVVRLQGS